MEQISSNETELPSPILQEAILKLTSMNSEEIKKAVIVLIIQLYQQAGLDRANNDASWDGRRASATSQAEAMMSFVIELGLNQSMLKPMLDLVIACVDTTTKDSRLLMTERSANKLRLSKSWSAGGSLWDRAQKTAIIVTSKVLQRRQIAPDHAHRLLAAKLKAFGQKGTDRSIAMWEKQHDAAIICARKRGQKNVQTARRVRSITAPRIRNALTTANWSGDAIEEMLNKFPCSLEVLQDDAFLMEAEINDAKTLMEDWSLERVLESFEEHLISLNSVAR